MLRKHRSIFASAVAVLCGARLLPHARRGGYVQLFSAPDNGGGTPPAPALTLEQRLASATGERDAARNQAATLTSERDAARSERDSLQGQFNAATAAATAANGERDAARGQVSTLTSERDTARTSLSAAQANVARLETLCQVKGLDHQAAPPALPANGPAGGGGAEHIYDQWQNARKAGNSSLASTLWRANRAAIRSEGDRRAQDARRQLV